MKTSILRVTNILGTRHCANKIAEVSKVKGTDKRPGGFLKDGFQVLSEPYTISLFHEELSRIDVKLQN